MITTNDGLIAAFNHALLVQCIKYGFNTKGAGTFTSLFRKGAFPLPGLDAPDYNAGSGYSCDSTTKGAIPLPTVTGDNKLYMLWCNFQSTYPGTAIFYDRLWACSGIPTNGSGSQTYTITTPGTLPRNTTEGGELWIEIYANPGGSSATWAASYTNQDGTAGRTATYSHPDNSEEAHQMVIMSLEGDDTGVRSVQSVTTSGSSGSAGEIGIVILKRLTTIGCLNQNIGVTHDWASIGMPDINSAACLTWMFLSTSDNTGWEYLQFKLGQG